MDRIKKNFGFGCMRLPMSGDEVNKVQMSDGRRISGGGL